MIRYFTREQWISLSRQEKLAELKQGTLVVKHGSRYYLPEEHGSPQDYFEGKHEKYDNRSEKAKQNTLKALDRLGIDRRSKHVILGEFCCFVPFDLCLK